MKIAVFGKGKTGSKVIEKLNALNIPYIVFDSVFLPNPESLKDIDVVISFVPGDVLERFFPMFIENRKNIVIGSTGFNWPSNIEQTLVDNKLTWIYSSNFSMGMAIIKNIIELVSKAEDLLGEATYSIHEVHHTKKLDSPSGTALSWQKWLNKKVSITSERTGDVQGYHELKIETPTEDILLSHNVKDRMIFADGAIFAAKKIVTDPNSTKGLINFFDLIKNNLKT